MAAGWTIGCSGVLATRARTAVAFVAAPVPTATLTLTLAALAPAASRPRFPPSAPPLPHCVETAAMQPDVSRLPLPALCLSACWSSSPSLVSLTHGQNGERSLVRAFRMCNGQF